MTVFLGWSGESKEYAEKLKALLSKCFSHHLTLKISTNLPKGGEWPKDLEDALQTADFGILCVTDDSRASWLCYEAGVLSAKGNVATLLFDVKEDDLFPPLRRFQNVRFNQTDMQTLMETLHGLAYDLEEKRNIHTHLDMETMLEKFNDSYPEFEREIRALRPSRYTADDLAKDLTNLASRGGNMEWIYHAGMERLDVLRSDRSLLEKAESLKDYREKVLKEYLKKYGDSDDQFVKRLLNKTERLQ